MVPGTPSVGRSDADHLPPHGGCWSALARARVMTASGPTVRPRAARASDTHQRRSGVTYPCIRLCVATLQGATLELSQFAGPENQCVPTDERHTVSGQGQPSEVVDSEQRPRGPRDYAASVHPCARQCGVEDRPGVGGEEQQRGGGQRPFSGAFPARAGCGHAEQPCRRLHAANGAAVIRGGLLPSTQEKACSNYRAQLSLRSCQPRPASTEPLTPRSPQRRTWELLAASRAALALPVPTLSALARLRDRTRPPSRADRR